MVSFEQALSDSLCGIKNELNKIRLLTEQKEHRDSDVFFLAIPEAGGTRTFSIGTTKINFSTGVITNPDGSTEQLNLKLNQFSIKDLHSISISSDQDVILRIATFAKRTIKANFDTQIPYLTYTQIEITCTFASNISIFASTNPEAIVSQFKPPTNVTLDQTNVAGDSTEATTWDATTASLINNMNRIRNQIISITGEAWGTVSNSISGIWAKFNATTGHKHSGSANDGGQVDHVNLASKGTNTHAQIDTFIASKASASGLASLDAGTKVPTAQLGGAGADATKFLRGDQSWQTVTTSVPTGTGFRHITSGSEDAASKLVANADVDSSAAIDFSKLDSRLALIKVISYTGDGTDDRALAHGFGVAPIYATLDMKVSTYIGFGSIYGTRYRQLASNGSAIVVYEGTVAAADSTNIYVGDSAYGNESGGTYVISIYG